MVVFASCQKNNDFTTIQQELEAFDNIEIHSSFDVYLIEDSVYSIKIQGYERNTDMVDFTVSNSTLNITNNAKHKFVTPTKNKIEVYIRSKPLKKVTSHQTGHIETINPITSYEFGLILNNKSNSAKIALNSTKFYYWNSFPCGGLLELYGKTEVLKIWNYALMKVDAQNLEANTGVIYNNSKSDIDINISQKLNYAITNTGNIVLHNQPEEIIEDTLSSTGRLIHE